VECVYFGEAIPKTIKSVKMINNIICNELTTIRRGDILPMNSVKSRGLCEITFE